MTKKKHGKTVVAVSGGFDPIHTGHVRYISEAKKLGDELVVILNNDNWLKAKKGFVFMPETERAELVRQIKGVDRVVLSSHKPHDPDRSVSRELAKIKPDVFANGGDRRNEADIPETVVCTKYGIKMEFGIGPGGKVQSSSWLTNNIARGGFLEVRPWGQFELFKSEKRFWLKTLSISPGRRLSLQKHKGRTELWVCVEGELVATVGKKTKRLKFGDSVFIPKGTLHRLFSKSGGKVIEVGFGPDVRESDIMRVEDDFGRK